MIERLMDAGWPPEHVRLDNSTFYVDNKNRINQFVAEFQEPADFVMSKQPYVVDDATLKQLLRIGVARKHTFNKYLLARLAQAYIHLHEIITELLPDHTYDASLHTHPQNEALFFLLLDTRRNALFDALKRKLATKRQLNIPISRLKRIMRDDVILSRFTNSRRLGQQSPTKKLKGTPFSSGPFPEKYNYSGNMFFVDIVMLQNNFRGGTRQFQNLEPYMCMVDLYSRKLWMTRVHFQNAEYTRHALAVLLQQVLPVHYFRYTLAKTIQAEEAPQTDEQNEAPPEIDSFWNDIHAPTNVAYKDLRTHEYGDSVPIRYGTALAYTKVNMSAALGREPEQIVVSVDCASVPPRGNEEKMKLLQNALDTATALDRIADAMKSRRTFQSFKKNGVETTLESAEITFDELRDGLYRNEGAIEFLPTAREIAAKSESFADFEQNLTNLYGTEHLSPDLVLSQGSNKPQKDYIAERVKGLKGKKIGSALTDMYRAEDLRYDIRMNYLNVKPNHETKTYTTSVVNELRGLHAASGPLWKSLKFKNEKVFDEVCVHLKRVSCPRDIKLEPTRYAKYSHDNTVFTYAKSHEPSYFGSLIYTDGSKTDFGRESTDLIGALGFKHIRVNKTTYNGRIMSPIETQFRQLRLMLLLFLEADSIYDPNEPNPEKFVSKKKTKDFSFSNEDLQGLIRTRNKSLQEAIGYAPDDLWMTRVTYRKAPNFAFGEPSANSSPRIGSLVDLVRVGENDHGAHTGLRRSSWLVVAGRIENGTETLLELSLPLSAKDNFIEFPTKAQREFLGSACQVRLHKSTFVLDRVSLVKPKRLFSRRDSKRKRHIVLDYHGSFRAILNEGLTDFAFIIKPAKVHGRIVGVSGVCLEVELENGSKVLCENPVRIDQIGGPVQLLRYYKRNNPIL